MSNDHVSPVQKAEEMAAKAAALEAELTAETDTARQKALNAKIRLVRELEQFHRERVVRAEVAMNRNRKDFRYSRTQNVKLAE